MSPSSRGRAGDGYFDIAVSSSLVGIIVALVHVLENVVLLNHENGTHIYTTVSIRR